MRNYSARHGAPRFKARSRVPPPHRTIALQAPPPAVLRPRRWTSQLREPADVDALPCLFLFQRVAAQHVRLVLDGRVGRTLDARGQVQATGQQTAPRYPRQFHTPLVLRSPRRGGGGGSPLAPLRLLRRSPDPDHADRVEPHGTPQAQDGARGAHVGRERPARARVPSVGFKPRARIPIFPAQAHEPEEQSPAERIRGLGCPVATPARPPGARVLFELEGA